MSIAARDAKWRMFPWSCAGQATPVHRTIAPSSSRIAAAPQTGHFRGNWNSFSSPVRFEVMTLTISGITSPARRTKTQSPARTSRRRTSSSLCSVARDTVTPAPLTEAPPLVLAVHLHHHAVYFVGEVVALREEPLVGLADPGHAGGAYVSGV